METEPDQRQLLSNFREIVGLDAPENILKDCLARYDGDLEKAIPLGRRLLLHQ